MFIPKKNRVAIYAYLFKEGVCVVKKDTALPTHPEIEGVSNLEVMMLMKSLNSRELVRTTFSWQYSYCYLTETGVEYLRGYLALPEEIKPATLMKSANKPEAREREAEGARGGKFDRDAPRGDRDGYRKEGGFGRGGSGF
jgi:small subunit ribosomal protein S10e